VFNLTGSEIVFLLLLALVILGPEKLPEAVRKFGKTYGEFKKMAGGFQSELKTALDEPMREVRETAEAFRQAASIDGLGDLGFKDLLSGGGTQQRPAAQQGPSTEQGTALPGASTSPADDQVRRAEPSPADPADAAPDVEVEREPGIQFGTAAPPARPAEPVVDPNVREPGIQFTSAAPPAEQWSTSTVAPNEPPLAGAAPSSSAAASSPSVDDHSVDAAPAVPAGDEGTNPA
jgi:sec-independent protein translocase protein TatB